MRSRKRLSALVAVGVAAVMLSACSGGSEGGDGSSSGSLVLGSPLAPTTFAANDVSWANEAPYIQAVYDTLLRATPEGEIEPWLATEWSYDDERTVLTMALRDDVVFTDGTPFSAETAAQSVLGFKGGTSPYAFLLGRVADATAIDATTLQITLSEPDPGLLHGLTTAAGVQGSPAAFDSPEAQTSPVGSGPYLLDTAATVVGSSYVFTRNPDYWAPETQYYDDLTVTVLDNAQAQMSALQGDQVDVVNLLDSSAADQLEASGFVLHPAELDVRSLLLFDRDGQLVPELADVRVRQAIAHAFDRDAILQALADGRGTVTGQMFGESSPAFDPGLDQRYPYDPDRARQLLAEAGLANGFTLPLPQIPTGTTIQYDLIRQYLGDVGVTVELTQVPLQNAIADLTQAKWSAGLISLLQPATDWETAQTFLTEDATWNPFHRPDATVEQLVATIQQGTESEAAEAGRRLNEYVVEQAWFVPWYRVQSVIVSDSDIQVERQNDNIFPYLWNITPAQ
ncbi:ABC transporter substrate-binding protein [Pseudonocardia nematodicida]|uniref:ABC transporter substrate-binding protein n=1 Tax=Pseudonocardia nematodicida TaxID=1206997 RepID=A0ABV1KGG2_9PSEU